MSDSGSDASRDSSIRCILLDIEGTICPISFVKETLFPYALKALPAVLKSKWDDADFKPLRDAFPDEFKGSPEALQAHVEDLTRRDVKIAYLKNLQGYLWEHGYESGEYSTPLFSDVVPKLEFWRSEGRELAVYSSGSVFAQKLLFGHVKSVRPIAGAKRGHEHVAGVESDDEGPPPKKQSTSDNANGTSHEDDADLQEGQKAEDATTSLNKEESSTGAHGVEDLQYMISNWFDTTNAGPKTEDSSYTIIADVMEMSPGEILFLSDNVSEVEAALDAGMDAILINRPGNAPVSREDNIQFGAVDSFEEIELAQMTDRGDDSSVQSSESEAGAAAGEEDDDDGEE